MLPSSAVQGDKSCGCSKQAGGGHRSHSAGKAPIRDSCDQAQAESPPSPYHRVETHTVVAKTEAAATLMEPSKHQDGGERQGHDVR